MQADQKICHRCSAVFSADSLFCPQCGAPQLVLTEEDAERVAAEHASTSTSSAGPMPRITGSGRIRWRPVLHIMAVLVLVAALAVGLGSALPGLSLVGWFFVFSAPMFTLNLYQRKSPGATMSAAVGARIGVTLGVIMAFVLTAVDVARELISRYALHHGSDMDQAIAAAVQSMKERMAANPSAAANSTESLRQIVQFFSTPDGHAALGLMSGAMMAGGILIYCFFSGMVLGWLRPMPPRRNVV